jgi:hypothetical protein
VESSDGAVGAAAFERGLASPSTGHSLLPSASAEASRLLLCRFFPTQERVLMNHRILGRTGVRVSPLCLGAMMFGAWGNQDHDESIRIVHRALDAGINFIDTADLHSAGESEAIVAKALAGGKREEQLGSQLGAADVTLSAEILDAIDAIVPPAINLNYADQGWDNPSLVPAARRRMVAT